MQRTSCVRKISAVVRRESESHLNTLVYSTIPVVMETAELSESVKRLEGLSVTKLIIKQNKCTDLICNE